MQKLEGPQNKFYDTAWETWSDMISFSPAPKYRRKKIIKWLSTLDCSSLLDVGCGNGEFLFEVHKVLPGLNLVGADVSNVVIDSNRTRLPEADFFVYDLNTEEISETYDIVVCMEVVEHCSDYRVVLRKLATMTKHALLITVPCGPIFEIDKRVGHVRHFTSDEIKDVLMDEGLDILKIQCWGFPFFNLYKHLINIFPDKTSDSFLTKKYYSWEQKFLATLTYSTFQLNLPFFGYQLFALAVRTDQVRKKR